MLSQRNNNILFFIIPILLPVVFLSAEYWFSADTIPAFYAEFGPAEFFQESILFVSLLLSLFIFTRLKPDQSKWLKIWIGLAALSCFYIFIEEISWGQKFFDWETPEKWAELNAQGETNIHNSSQIFNSVPRTLLEIGILVGGLFIPALLKWAPSKLPQKFAPVYPQGKIAFLAVITVIMKLFERFPSWFDIEIFWRKSEVMETFFYYFIFLYLISILQTWSAQDRFKPQSLLFAREKI